MEKLPKYKEMNLKIAGLNMDLLSTNATGPLSWIKEGTFDIDLWIYAPLDSTSTSVDHSRFLNDQNPQILHPEDDSSLLWMQWNLKLNHIQLHPPIYSPDLSPMGNVLLQPVYRYMNAHANTISLSFESLVPEHRFDGAWTMADAGLWDTISQSVYEALVIAMEHQKRRTDLWTVLRYMRQYFFQ